MIRFLALALLVGCVPLSYSFTPSTSGSTPKPEGCKIEVLTGPPATDFEEVGTLAHYNGEPPTDLEKFRKAVHKRVCEVGGDAVIAMKNEKGQYMKGTVIKAPQKFRP